MAAVMDNALAALERDCEDAEVWEWIGVVGSGYAYSFEGICEALHLDASAVRTALHRWHMRAPQWRGRSTVTLRYLIVRRPVVEVDADAW
jgi:hypothetical protein